MKFLGIYPATMADGLGVRTSLYLSGCDMDTGTGLNGHCLGCHNPESHCFENGDEFDERAEKTLMECLSKPYIAGLCLSGGDPFSIVLQKESAELLERVKKALRPDQNVWAFTGFEWEDLLEGGRRHTEWTDKMLENIDVMVCGPFILAQRDITEGNVFRGSRNQYILDVKASLKEGKRVYLENIANNPPDCKETNDGQID